MSTAKTSTTGEAAASLEGPMEHKGGLVQTVSGSLVLSRGPGAVRRERFLQKPATDRCMVTADYGSRHNTTHTARSGAALWPPPPTGALSTLGGSSPAAASPAGGFSACTKPRSRNFAVLEASFPQLCGTRGATYTDTGRTQHSRARPVANSHEWRACRRTSTGRGAPRGELTRP